jgi:hypothetical protein
MKSRLSVGLALLLFSSVLVLHRAPETNITQIP